MTVVLKNLNGEDARILKDLSCIYLQGECYAFAIALNRELGWQMVGLRYGGTIHHAMAREPHSGTLYDARGPIPLEELGKPFGVIPPYELADIVENDLRAIRPVQECSIMRAMRIAEALWPQLPWKNSFQDRVRIFAEELEELSRKHGLWVRAFIPPQLPVLVPGDGKETGYVLQPTIGGTFTINTVLS